MAVFPGLLLSPNKAYSGSSTEVPLGTSGSILDRHLLVSQVLVQSSAYLSRKTSLDPADSSGIALTKSSVAPQHTVQMLNLSAWYLRRRS